jgi:PDZ domain-containing protein
VSSRKRFWTTSASVLTVALLVAAVAVPVPFLSRSPGPVFDVLGEADGEQVLEVTGTRSYPTPGQLDLTTVAELGGESAPITAAVALLDWFSPSAAVVPDEERRTEADRELDVAVFDASQTYALAAAADYLDRPVRSSPVVVRATPGSPADGLLLAGDEIRAVDGRRVTKAAQVSRRVAAEPAGTTFRFTVVREGKRRLVDVASRESEEVQRPVIGILVENSYTSDFGVTLNLDGIGGPSAGLVLSVGIVDKLTRGDLVAGRHVAGTGTISPSGEVGVISGIDKKMSAARAAGAELFLAPRGNCADVVSQVPDGLTAVPVETLDEAVAVLEQWREGRAVQACPAETPSDNND